MRIFYLDSISSLLSTLSSSSSSSPRPVTDFVAIHSVYRLIALKTVTVLKVSNYAPCRYPNSLYFNNVYSCASKYNRQLLYSHESYMY